MWMGNFQWRLELASGGFRRFFFPSGFSWRFHAFSIDSIGFQWVLLVLLIGFGWVSVGSLMDSKSVFAVV